jgi:hypothetical protein
LWHTACQRESGCKGHQSQGFRVNACNRPFTIGHWSFVIISYVSQLLLIAWRNLKKNRVFSFVNILGLAIGMAACLLILQYVSFELSFDRFHANAADLYRVTNDRFQNGKLIQHGTITYSAVGKAHGRRLSRSD